MTATADDLVERAGSGSVGGSDSQGADGITEFRRQETLIKTGALQDAIFNSANFSSIATDAKGVIQIFNVGAERMLGYAAADVMDKITPADISRSAGSDRASASPESGIGYADYTRL